jgi:hypothetical protein
LVWCCGEGGGQGWRHFGRYRSQLKEEDFLKLKVYNEVL